MSLPNLSLHSVAAPPSTLKVPVAAKGCVLEVGTEPLPLHFLGRCWLLASKAKWLSAAVFHM